MKHGTFKTRKIAQNVVVWKYLDCAGWEHRGLATSLTAAVWQAMYESNELPPKAEAGQKEIN